jgi:hypothetical protein
LRNDPLPWQLTVAQLRSTIAQVPDDVVVSFALPPSTPRQDQLTIFSNVQVVYTGGPVLQLRPSNSPTAQPPGPSDGQIGIAAAGNVLVPAVLALEAQGFTVTCAHVDGGDTWTATRDDLTATASDPLEVLGLVALVRSRGSQWSSSDPEIADVMGRFKLD